MAQRQPSGQLRKSRRSENDGPTPEAKARRKALLGSETATGEIDSVLDILASPAEMVLTERQAEAGRRYASARLSALRAAGVNPVPSSPKLADWVDKGGIAPLAGGDDGKAAFRWRKARVCVFDCGGDVRRAVDRVCLDNAAPKEHEIVRLRIGLDALVRLWKL